MALFYLYIKFVLFISKWFSCFWDIEMKTIVTIGILATFVYVAVILNRDCKEKDREVSLWDE